MSLDEKRKRAQDAARAKAREKGDLGQSASAPSEWSDPIPLADLPEAEPFPGEAIPTGLAEFVAAVSEATNTPPDYAASFALAIAAGTIGATRACEIKAGHIQRASVFLTVVARKGSTKSPALDAVARPVYDEQSRLRRDGNGEKAFTSDVTAEKLAILMQTNSRGMLLIRDELAGWLSSFNQYKAGGRGSDRQFFLSAWSGSPVSVDRKGKDKKDDAEVFVRYPCLSVVGTIQPSVLDRFKADADDGFYDRVLFCYPNEWPLVGEQWNVIDPELASRWADALGEIRRVKMEDGRDGPRPFFMTLDANAREVWQAWTNDVAKTVNAADFDDVLRGPYVKLAGYAARLAIVVHGLREGFGESLPREIDGVDMECGVALGRYFLSHATRVWAAAGIDSRFTPVKRLLKWITTSELTTFSRRDAHRALVRQFPTSGDLTEPLSMLVQHGYIRYATAPDQKPAPGRPTVTYEVHPQFCQRSQRVNGVSASTHEGGDQSTSER